jgi:DNA polymerase III epsilon subunit-like protein
MLWIAIIDFEATALSIQADPIEVGVAIFDREKDVIRTWSSLIRPSADCLWDEKSAGVHKIGRAEADVAPEASSVACELNRIMAGTPVAYCDGYEFDQSWSSALFRNAQIEATFKLKSIEEMPRMHLRVVRHHIRAYLGSMEVPHRAGEDALRLMKAYTYALGKNPKAEAV